MCGVVIFPSVITVEELTEAKKLYAKPVGPLSGESVEEKMLADITIGKSKVVPMNIDDEIVQAAPVVWRQHVLLKDLDKVIQNIFHCRIHAQEKRRSLDH